ncbi:MAG: NAD(P)/FAD-dependent oxidoreductase, partial [Ignavibacteria bacterium]|nr:NAD(P)/FAD-dependent oxidoreductase [Ignavibacteria bacterium]
VSDVLGNKYRWKKLILCNGASPILPDFKGSENKNIFVLRSAADTEKIREGAKEVEKILVVGGGVLGVEIAEQLSKLGKNITIVHRDLLLLNKHFDSNLSQRLMNLLTENGIQVIMNEEVKSVSSVGNNKLFINIGSLIQLMADMMVFSVGVNPNISILKRSGINFNKGILVNEFLETSVENIYAAGDVAEHANGTISGLWHAAELQGIIAGSNAAEQKIPLPQKAFRLKLEVFEAYFFSMNIPNLSREQDEIIVDQSEKYYRFFFEKGLLTGMLMANDKPMTKICEQAVRENWSKEKVIQTFIEV